MQNKNNINRSLSIPEPSMITAITIRVRHNYPII